MFVVQGRAVKNRLTGDDVRELADECEAQRFSSLHDADDSDSSDVSPDSRVLPESETRLRAFFALATVLERALALGWRESKRSYSFPTRTPSIKTSVFDEDDDDEREPTPPDDWDIIQMRLDLRVDNYLNAEVPALQNTIERSALWLTAISFRELLSMKAPTPFFLEAAHAFHDAATTRFSLSDVWVDDQLGHFDSALKAQVSVLDAASAGVVRRLGASIRSLVQQGLAAAATKAARLSLEAASPIPSRGTSPCRPLADLWTRVVVVDGVKNIAVTTAQCMALLASEFPEGLITANLLFPCDASASEFAVGALALRIRRAAEALGSSTREASMLLGTRVGLVITALDALSPPLADKLLAACSMYAEASRRGLNREASIAPMIFLCLAGHEEGRQRVFSFQSLARADALAPPHAKAEAVQVWLETHPSPSQALRLVSPVPFSKLCVVSPSERARGAIYSPHQRVDHAISRSANRILLSASMTADELASSLKALSPHDAMLSAPVVLDACGSANDALLGPAGSSILSLLLFGCTAQAQDGAPWMPQRSPGAREGVLNGTEAASTPLLFVLEVLADVGSTEPGKVPWAAKGLTGIFFTQERSVCRPLVPSLRGKCSARDASVRALRDLAEKGPGPFTDNQVYQVLAHALETTRTSTAEPKPFTWMRRHLLVAAQILERTPIGASEQ